MAATEFGIMLKTNREVRGLSRPDLAREMARECNEQKGMEGQLIRLEEGTTKKPRKDTVKRVATALSKKANDTWLQKDQLLYDLLQSAGYADNSKDHVDQLKKRCRARLRLTPNTDLNEHQIQTIVDGLTTATLQRIATSKQKAVSVRELKEFAVELQRSAAELTGNEADEGSIGSAKKYTFRVGPVTISVDRPVSEILKTMIRHSANMISDVHQSQSTHD